MNSGIAILLLFSAEGVCVNAIPGGGVEERHIVSVIYHRSLLQNPAVGETLVATVTGEMLNLAPRWRQDRSNPPLSVRSAITRANRMRSRLVRNTDNWHWHLDSVTLCPLFPATPDDRWFWQVVYRVDSQGGYTGPVDELRLVVLMNGTVVKPVAPGEETGGL